jgi:hypothetical protein
LALAGFCLAPLAAQEAKSPQDDSVPTLRVYTNLVQTAVIVLDLDRKPIPPVPESRFFVSLDGGPRFRVTHARLEGDDPISLAILLDLNQPFPDLMKYVGDSMATLAPLFLNSKDQISIYSMDCQLLLAESRVPAQPAALKQAINRALQSWTARGRNPPKDCKKPIHLWDSLTGVTQTIARQPGHRVILAVTDGVDRGSKISWNALSIDAALNGVAIFGLLDSPPQLVLNNICDATGGMLLTTDRKTLPKSLQAFTAILRGRYIVEFPRPRSNVPGYHGMEISVDRTIAFIRTSGAQIPLDDPTIVNDPSTIQSDPTHAPTLGSHRPPPPN